MYRQQDLFVLVYTNPETRSLITESLPIQEFPTVGSIYGYFQERYCPGQRCNFELFNQLDGSLVGPSDNSPIESALSPNGSLNLQVIPLEKVLVKSLKGMPMSGFDYLNTAQTGQGPRISTAISQISQLPSEQWYSALGSLNVQDQSDAREVLIAATQLDNMDFLQFLMNNVQVWRGDLLGPQDYRDAIQSARSYGFNHIMAYLNTFTIPFVVANIGSYPVNQWIDIIRNLNISKEEDVLALVMNAIDQGNIQLVQVLARNPAIAKLNLLSRPSIDRIISIANSLDNPGIANYLSKLNIPSK